LNRPAAEKEFLLNTAIRAHQNPAQIPGLQLDLQSQDILASIVERTEPDQASAIRALILDAAANTWGEQSEPDTMRRFLIDISIAQDMPGIEMDYAGDYAQMFESGLDFLNLIQTVQAAKRLQEQDGESWFSEMFQSVFS